MDRPRARCHCDGVSALAWPQFHSIRLVYERESDVSLSLSPLSPAPWKPIQSRRSYAEIGSRSCSERLHPNGVP